MTLRSARPILQILVAALVAIPLTFLLEPVERRVFDLRLSLRRAAPWPADLVMVPIDDAAMKKYGRWPWPRERIADLLDALQADGAKTVMADLIFGAPTTPEADARLAASLSRTLIAVGYARGGEPDAGPALRNAMIGAEAYATDDPRAQFHAENLVVPMDGFAEAARGVGHTIFENRSDAAVRGHLPLLHVEGLPGSLPSLPLLAWAEQHGLDTRAIRGDGESLTLPDGKRIPLYRGEMYLDFAPRIFGDQTDLPPSVDAAAILARPGDPSLKARLSGKLALVHIDSVSEPDELVTPISPTTPGGLVLAYAIRTFESGRAPRPISKWPTLAALFALALAAAFPLSRRAPAQVLAATAGALGLLVAAALLLARADFFPYVVEPGAFVLLAGALLATDAARGAEAERRQLKALLASSQSAASAAVARGEAVEPRATTLPTRASPADAVDVAPDLPPRGAAAMRDLPHPVEIGRYTVLRAIGRGGMGAIFLARDKDLDRFVALKVLEAADQEAFLRFRREALSVARIVHPCVVQIHEVGFDASVPYLVMEYVAGGSLSDLLRDPSLPSPIDWRRATRIALGIARGLGAAHAVGIVHRDVKPSNILLVSPDADDVKIADFGIAKLAGGEALTKEGSFIGTIGYMSPEQAMGLEVDARSDVYSLGVAWYRMLTGRAAFEGATAQVLRAAAAQPVPDPRRLVPSLPEAVTALMARMTALDRAARIKDGTEAAAALEALLMEGDSTAPRAAG